MLFDSKSGRAVSRGAKHDHYKCKHHLVVVKESCCEEIVDLPQKCTQYSYRKQIAAAEDN